MIEFRCQQCGQFLAFEESRAGRHCKCGHCQAQICVPHPPLELPMEVTPGGSVVYRHEPGSRTWAPALGNDSRIQLISDHIHEHLGEVDSVWHEIVSDLVHVDIHHVAPTLDRPFHSLVTSGMSDVAMNTPTDARDYERLELMICLPEDWPVSEQDFESEAYYWPVRWLKRLARFPHEFDTWLSYGHTVPNGDPPQPLAANNQFTGWLVAPPKLAPDPFSCLEIEDESPIHFAAIVPLYQQEMQLKLEVGMEVLLERMAGQHLSELVDVDRPNVAGLASDWGPAIG